MTTTDDTHGPTAAPSDVRPAQQLAELIGHDTARALIQAGWDALRAATTKRPDLVHPGVADYVATTVILGVLPLLTNRTGRLCRTLAEIAAVDPSRHGHTGPDSPEMEARYNRRNTLIWSALAQAHEAGLLAGVGYDPDDPRPVVVYIELPGAGQVSWHLPAHRIGWDGHTTEAKYQRVDLFTGTLDVPERTHQ